MQSSGTVGSLHAKVGETWWIALPVPSNTSAELIEITDVAVEHVPDGITVVEYAAYDRNDTEGLPLLARAGDPHSPDFARLKNHATRPVRVPAHTESDIFYTAKVKITAPPRDTIRQCRFNYRQGERRYTQTLDCEVELKTE